ncbi:uncharacterized protein TRIVIDRAFT_51553 [Trichoderma virens Gv29-8]|uniref:Uncharacterized protein n=1 Tax=Hypocrea virens (strain Gv29-8 / FGSC 10586) TaxID=413071 RepID=G9MWT7_HYPVG|nr:uncharacterized protein TRIVIDRAFT_51553 [Trichoderma virens Gv29-8]EHK21070.1 hypothetical protein TRIVIDRAFT_51553 [Trichoderma virens Gv29-8]
MQAPTGPTTMPWIKAPIVIRNRYRDFKRWLRKDKTTVSCIADMIQPPPPYQAVRRDPPVHGELDNLQFILYHYRRQLFSENGIDRELLSADIESLHRWIQQLEYLIYWDLATTIPTRFRHEPIKDRILRRIRRLRGEDPPPIDEDDDFLEDEII